MRTAALPLILILALLQGCAGAIVAAGAGGASMAADRRTTGTIVEDQSIEMKVSNYILADAEIKEKTHISITSYNGIVLLSGEAPTAALRDRAGERAAEVEKVRKVQNEIAVGTPSDLKSRSEDTWITTKIKTKLLGDKRVNSIHVKVVTENHTVFLLGLVTHTEAEAAVDASSQTEGVQRVVKIFEYLD